MTRRLVFFLLTVLTALAAGSAARAGGDAGGVDVVVVSGPLDGRLTDFVIRSIRESDAAVVVLQMDSPATLDGDVEALIALVEDPPIPVAVYAGPAPARVAGGALRILAAAQIRGAAPGVDLGPASPTRAGGPDDAEEIQGRHPVLGPELISSRIRVSDDLGGLLDLVEPSIGQFVVGLDGRSVTVGGETRVLTTAEEISDGEVVSIRPSVQVTFVQPGLIDRTLRLGVGPEAAFFFIVAGLSLAVFEFYAAGPGVAAAIAVSSLFIGGYGVAVLPVRWWAVALIPIGVALYTIDFQRNDLGWKSILGTAALAIGGLLFTDASPQLVQTWWIVLLVVIGAALWFGFALTTVVRSRFSTQTIGRDHLVGRVGTAATAIEPDGTILLDGARWRARSSRVSGIGAGDPVEVVAVEGIVLEVDPVRE